MKVLVTGGAGFIGSAVCRLFISELDIRVLNVAKLAYAANLTSLSSIDRAVDMRFGGEVKHRIGIKFMQDLGYGRPVADIGPAKAVDARHHAVPP